ncbi:hypothetical protein KSF_077380 [Reticulibacter mediterranei]|uniref:DUF1772 domain-containing protein n=1 Tax=Reticulibacter mediterranei TaxID=2778369 RepID=A0A8J3N6R0_9CHLR|nr:hypothetical protein [Reticulibacter mediterranei]GHO97690.1 hypothetical protein KSF_077380 [Reticulibacter mediterranei]
MALLALLDFVNLFFAGMLAGIEFVIHYGVREPAEQLSDHAQLQLRKALILKLRVLVPAFFAPTAILGITLTALNGGTPSFGYRCVGVVALLIWIAIRVIGTVPINSATADWQLDSPPTDWKAQIDHAERFHIVGVWAIILAFACLLIAVSFKLPA